MSGSIRVTSGEPLAHSPRNGAGVQTYRVHVTCVHERADQNARRALHFFTGSGEAKDSFQEIVSAAALYHDLGKMDEENQKILSVSSKDALPVRHEDAGVAALFGLGRETSAQLVFAHHAGLMEWQTERREKSRDHFLRQYALVSKSNQKVVDRTDVLLASYLQRHENDARMPVLSPLPHRLKENGFTLRLALSCLVDADHGDTAHHYGNEPKTTPLPTRWAERLAALDAYVNGLKGKGARDERRRRVYEVCRSAAILESMRSCDAPVGSGKTTAIMAHLLQVAQARGLRHLIVVLPYTNIIKQSVEVYRKALTLPGEKPEEVVAEHHHLADFGSVELRHLTTLWQAPIIVTTAVQFFETLASYHPARLRKLHELPGSAVFVDEVHAAIPTQLWGQVWRWLHDWTAEWQGYIVFASGSLPRFWEIPAMSELIQTGGVKKENDKYPLPDAKELLPDTLRSELGNEEQSRVIVRSQPVPMKLGELLKFVQSKPGPRLVILNTVQSAAVLAMTMRDKGHHVLHLSTALSPADRERMVERVYALLTARSYQDWTLVATSCVEAGMNFSFRTGFRERSSAASLIQIGGRVNRDAEYTEAEVWDFQTQDEQLTGNPGLESSIRALQQLIEEGSMNGLSPGEFALNAMKQELGAREDQLQKAESLQKAERLRNYHSVTEQARVIATDTRTVIISEALAHRIAGNEKVSPCEIQRHSVQIWADKLTLNKLPATLLKGEPEAFDALYTWQAEYDPDFLGYMAGALEYTKLLKEGGIIV